MPLPPGLTLDEVNKIDGEGIPEGEILFTEHAGGVEATVEGDVEQPRGVGIGGAAGVVLKTRVQDHLSDELVRGVPGGGGEGLAKAIVGDMGAHVGVDVEVLTVVEELQVEAGGEGVDVEERS